MSLKDLKKTYLNDEQVGGKLENLDDYTAAIKTIIYIRNDNSNFNIKLEQLYKNLDTDYKAIVRNTLYYLYTQGHYQDKIRMIATANGIINPENPSFGIGTYRGNTPSAEQVNIIVGLLNQDKNSGDIVNALNLYNRSEKDLSNSDRRKRSRLPTTSEEARARSRSRVESLVKPSPSIDSSGSSPGSRSSSGSRSSPGSRSSSGSRSSPGSRSPSRSDAAAAAARSDDDSAPSVPTSLSLVDPRTSYFRSIETQIAEIGADNNLIRLRLESAAQNKNIKYKDIKCGKPDSVIKNDDDCNDFLSKFINGNKEERHKFISDIAKNRTIQITNIENINPEDALLFLKELQFKRKKYISEIISKIIYRVETYNEWVDRMNADNKDGKKETYVKNPNVKRFIEDLVKSVNSNFSLLNKDITSTDLDKLVLALKSGIITDERFKEILDNLVKIPDERNSANVPKRWRDRGLKQKDTNEWYIEFYKQIKEEWNKEKDEFNSNKNFYGKPIDLVKDEPREGAQILFNMLTSPLIVPQTGGENVNSLLKSQWSEISDKIEEKELKLMGNVDIEEKIKEHGEIIDKKNELLKIMSDYNKFLNLNNLDSLKNIQPSVLLGGYQELLDKEDETLEYVSKKMYYVNRLLDHIE